MTEDEIILEGIGDDAYETFHFSRCPVKFAFCKTGNRPYDSPVVLILMLFSKLTHFSSDGDVDELPLDECELPTHARGDGMGFWFHRVCVITNV